jgi:Spy/CpxP family protein refolding chaperone
MLRRVKRYVYIGMVVLAVALGTASSLNQAPPAAPVEQVADPGGAGGGSGG